MSRDSLSIQAPAKLNLALAVGPRNETGLHPICSWMVTVDLYDELLLTRLENDRLSRYAILWHPDAKRRSDINWSVSKDLTVRAHLTLEKHVGRSLPIQLKLEKSIPVGSGLGGGSSDAAAMLRGVNELFQLGLTQDELIKIASSIGSDVPFFLYGGSATIEGTGDRVTPHAQPLSHDAVLVFPDVISSTSDVYRVFDVSSPTSLQADRIITLVNSRHAQLFDALFNDLTSAAMKNTPNLQSIANDFSKLAERQAYLSGSGSCLFVLCDSEVHASTLAEAAEQQLGIPAISVKSCTI